MPTSIKLLAVSGSPVKESSTDLLLAHIKDAITGHLPRDWQVDGTFVRLNELKFVPCQSCGKAPTPEFCFYEDDLTGLYDTVADCDCLLFGTPLYFDTVSSQAKAFIDRCNCLRPADFSGNSARHSFIRLIKKRRPGAMVLVGGEKGWFEGARRVVAGFFKWIEVSNEGTFIFHSDDYKVKGGVRENAAALAEAAALGRKLADILREQHG
ncbi:MAG: flavodoxin family protein [candidate division Zixibacteria bacterium]|nr:flavodoxin family protein [candidate division Zixibacteria bacterium]